MVNQNVVHLTVIQRPGSSILSDHDSNFAAGPLDEFTILFVPQILCGEVPNAAPMDLPARLKNGYFFRPTVIAGLADDSRCMQVSFVTKLPNLVSL